VDEVLGYVAGLRARRIVGGSVTGRVTAKLVGAGGQAIGLDVDTIGAGEQHAPQSDSAGSPDEGEDHPSST
jgi:hypothetical protein